MKTMFIANSHSFTPKKLQTSFCIPQFAVTIVWTAKKLGSGNVEADVSDGFTMSKICTHTSAFIVYFPQLQ